MCTLQGIDLLALVIPEICRRHEHVDWLVGGDGPKRGVLERMVQAEGLAHRVRMLGTVAQDDVRSVLIQVGVVFPRGRGT